ncbi:hypothetical protein SDRG_15901 [Saprolegnia diclina VS20]|uniref:Uncharacterized protein n=1 Tax=Saprolegnia diclina (strain VS20) TaxID=1156394 RepID=T0PYT2_SAPDV|nr:hypothetical protein SDRG_15901 [Saprolegnia diclina VS20]EQC26240.1 hypothetical protein SDRG_15901 [Saprolegnia diclina VS20]|eukprot:XP_008620309.1 hypothetical protein SDRG_15901 [Saprolegnia diclina VS20]
MRVFRATDDGPADELVEVANGRASCVLKIAAPGEDGQRCVYYEDAMLGHVQRFPTPHDLQAMLQRHVREGLNTLPGWRAVFHQIDRDYDSFVVSAHSSLFGSSEIEIELRVAGHCIRIGCGLGFALTRANAFLDHDDTSHDVLCDDRSLETCLDRIQLMLHDQKRMRQGFVESIRAHAVVLQVDTTNYLQFVVLVQHDVTSHAWIDIVEVTLPLLWGLFDSDAGHIRGFHVKLRLVSPLGKTEYEISADARNQIARLMESTDADTATFVPWLLNVLQERFAMVQDDINC